MNTGIVCWGGKTLATVVDPDPDDAASIYFRDDDNDASDYCRIFMTKAQMQTLRDQLTVALEAMPDPEPEPEPAEAAAV